MKFDTRQLVRMSLLAALYVALTLILRPFSYGVIQVRVSEALTVLPYLTPAAIPALFVGVIIANLLGGLGILDIVLGSLATLVAGVLTWKMPRPWLAPLPPVLVNAVIVGAYLSYLFSYPTILAMLWVGAGQIVACYILGYPLLVYLRRRGSWPGTRQGEEGF